MKKILLCALAFTLIGAAQLPPAPSPNEIVAAAPAGDWLAIAPSDLLVMTLANGKQVIIQLMPAPFSQGWISNIRTLVAAKWWDGLTINRLQDNYVVQWGDASEKKALPAGVSASVSCLYEFAIKSVFSGNGCAGDAPYRQIGMLVSKLQGIKRNKRAAKPHFDSYLAAPRFASGWPLATDGTAIWPVHCYGMVGVGRNLPPDTGSGAELYTVIGHAPRHLDRNIALVGRVIEGIEHLSSLPRGTEALGFYKTPEERTTITSIRIGTATADLPRFEYLSTESKSFATYADARANRRDPFFIKPAGGADICNIPVPVRWIK